MFVGGVLTSCGSATEKTEKAETEQADCCDKQVKDDDCCEKKDSCETPCPDHEKKHAEEHCNDSTHAEK